MASTVLNILNTPCYDLLPPFVKPFFQSNTFVPAPGSISIPLYGALLPPLTYYIALFLLSEPRPSKLDVVHKYLFAGTSAVSFLGLPFQYYVPGSATFSYQLGLIGCFGAARVIDIFFLSRPRVPTRIRVPQPGVGIRTPIEGHEHAEDEEERNGTVYPHTDNLTWSTEPLPMTIPARLWWALDLMISMRGIGWNFASADVRHDISPWQPPSRRQIRRALLQILPALGTAMFISRVLLATYLHGVEHQAASPLHLSHSVVEIPPHYRPLFVLATGVSLYSLFDAGYTLVSAMMLPAMKVVTKEAGSDLHNVDFFPLLNPHKLTEITSVRSFWSKAWHRLFHRAFLIFGILPFQNLALFLFPRPNAKILSPRAHPDPGRLLPKGTHDWAKVLGAFFASGMIHAISERAALGGRLALPANNLWLQAGWSRHHLAGLNLQSNKGLAGADHPGRWSVSRIVPPFSGGGEFTFFMLNGIAVLIEGAFYQFIIAQRKKAALSSRKEKSQSNVGSSGDVGSSSALERTALAARRAVAKVAGSANASEEDEIEELVKHPGTPPSEVVTPQQKVKDDSSRETFTRSYDRYVGLVWAVIVLLWSGEAFVSGWVTSGLSNELVFLPH